uniref:Uncharacterized protein n=1 Tax=Romanomermis culicivorax TaxID=13658 RepID=A0A915K2D8_ROMCU
MVKQGTVTTRFVKHFNRRSEQCTTEWHQLNGLNKKASKLDMLFSIWVMGRKSMLDPDIYLLMDYVRRPILFMSSMVVTGIAITVALAKRELGTKEQLG